MLSTECEKPGCLTVALRARTVVVRELPVPSLSDVENRAVGNLARIVRRKKATLNHLRRWADEKSASRFLLKPWGEWPMTAVLMIVVSKRLHDFED